MSEPFLERLSRFTPNAGGLDRDALLFAAGRASARPNRAWIALATLLTSTQVLSWSFCGRARRRRPTGALSLSPSLRSPRHR